MRKNPSELLQQHAKNNPEKHAVFFKKWFTYDEFNQLVGKLAKFLLNIGVQKNQGVNIYMDHSLESLALIFAIHRIGAYYIPFNKYQSTSLVSELVRESGFNHIFCFEEDLSKFENARVIDFDEIQNLVAMTEIIEGDYAYQIFTSGTTGKPKGVLVSNRNLQYIINLIDSTFPCSSTDVLIWNTPYTFDVSLVEIFGWVLNEGQIVIQNPEDIRALGRMAGFLLEHRVTHLNLSPTVLSSLLHIWTTNEIEYLNSQLRYLLVAGEAFPLDVALFSKKILPDVTVLNLYGPTEASVYATGYEVRGNENKILPIGKPLKNAKIRILDQEKKEVPDGSVGEIFIFGEGIAVGYSNDLEQTHLKFGEISGERFYSTGDYARILEDGNIEYLGRRDRQVQINGVRVELSSIESRMDTLFNHPGSVRVLYHKKRFHLFYTDNGITKQELQIFSKQHLNSYEIPTSFNYIDEFPLTPNRKLDERKILALISDNNLSSIEEKKSDIGDILQKVLAVFKFDRGQSKMKFADLGLDSLASLMGVAQLEKEFHVQLTEDLVMGDETPEKLAKVIIEKLGEGFNIKMNSDYGIIDNLKYQISNWKSTGSYIYSKEKLKLHNTYGLQKIYFHDNFESVVTVKFKISKKYSSLAVLDAMTNLINSIQVFRLGIEYNDKGLFFAELPRLASYNIPFVSIRSDSSAYREQLLELEDYLVEKNKKIVQFNFLYTPVVLEFENEFLIFLSISHLISDGSSQFILKKLFIETLINKSCESKDYTEFIEFIASRTDPSYILELEHSKYLIEIGKIAGLSYNFNSEIQKLKFKVNATMSINEKIAYLCFELGKEYSKRINVDCLTISLILNLRVFDGFDAHTIVGDIHSTIVTYYDAKDSLESFTLRLEQIMSEYLKGNNPYQAAFSSFPEMSSEQKKLEDIYDTNPIISLNYLGFLDEIDKGQELEQLEKTKKVLSAFPVNRVYLTALEESGNIINVYALNGVSKI